MAVCVPRTLPCRRSGDLDGLLRAVHLIKGLLGEELDREAGRLVGNLERRVRKHHLWKVREGDNRL